MHRLLPLILLVLSLPLRAAQKPNIVYILADDLGYGDLGCYNKESKIPTPHLDGLAREGMRFTDAHAPTSVCTPTRYAILTGRYSWRTKLQRGVLGPWSGPLIDKDRLTVPSLLQQNGYFTGAIGKWHLGLNWQTKDGEPQGPGPDNLSNVDFAKEITDGPTQHGFDTYFGTNVPNYPPYCFIENNRTVGLPTLRDTGREGGFNIPGPMVPDWKLVNILPTLTKRAVKFVEDNAKTGKPFFLYLPLTSPPVPVVPAPEFKGKSGAGDFGDFVVQTDWTVGQVLGALKRTGIADNTLVIFTSDNGPEITGEVNPGAYDRIKEYHHASVGPLRGAKRDAWEGGHRVPFMVRWPGKVQPNTENNTTICHVDFMATVAALLDVKLPDAAGVDSYSLLSLLTGAGTYERPATVHHSANGKFALRKGDWVLIDAPSGGDNKEPEWFRQERGIEESHTPGELFNVKEDLGERRNHFAEKPEIVTELKALLEKYKRDGRSTPGLAQANDVPIGTGISKGKGSKAKDKTTVRTE